MIRRATRLATLLASLACACELLAQEATPAANDWPMETVRLKDGRVLRGLVQLERPGEIEFIEIIRPPGRPMYGVLHPLARKEVASVTPLAEAERKALASRFAQFRHRAVIEAGRMESLEIEEAERDSQTWRVYRGDWFTVESTADDATTRRCIVRIDQTFRAFRLILPPRTSERRNLRIVLHGSMDDYRTHLQTLGLEISNAAFFSITQNEIIAGSDLSRYAEELARATAQSDAIRREYLDLDKALPEKLKQLASEMQRRGFSRDEVRAELLARRNAWSARMQAMEQQSAEIQRRNDAHFQQVTRDMFRRLSHEAFHAYVENYVFPQAQGGLPLWLNEGLAQIFESGQLEVDALRIDAPDKTLLARLQQDLRTDPLPLKRLLLADGGQFVKAHGSESTDRNYLYAWGLAWYLTFEFDLLRGDRLEAYCTDSGDPLARFEKLVGQPLDRFEPAWRGAMLRLR